LPSTYDLFAVGFFLRARDLLEDLSPSREIPF